MVTTTELSWSNLSSAADAPSRARFEHTTARPAVVQAERHTRFRKLPRPNNSQHTQMISELESLRRLTRAREIFVFAESKTGRAKFLAASPPNSAECLPEILKESDYLFVERGGCTFAFTLEGAAPFLGEASTLCQTTNGKLVEDLIAKALGYLILEKNNSIVRQVGDNDSACLAISSRFFLSLIEKADLIASSDRPALVLGETGVGKGLMARLIHQMSGRDKFVVNSMAQVQGDSAISELFGHLKGAFTGAHARRLGAFLETGDGTLFLDEIAEMPDSAAALLLRAVEERKIKPLGSDKEFAAPARIVAATNRPECLRKDLFYRFVHRIVIPPLRERPLDIHAVARFVAFREGFELTAKAFRALERISPWKGNARELEFFLLQAATQTNKHLLGIDDVMRTFASTSSIEHGLARVHSPVRDIRMNLGFTIREFSTVLGMPKSTLNDIERSRIPERDAELLVRIGEKLDLLVPKRRSGSVAHELKRFIAEE